MASDDFSAASSTTPPSPTRGGSFALPHLTDLTVDLHAPPSGTWATELLLECAAAVSGGATARANELMWLLNELSSPYGDTHQRLTAYFLRALLALSSSSATSSLRALAAAGDRNRSFESTRRTALRFQDVSPWCTFGHVASNGAILEALEGEPFLHILDLSNTFCTQWPTFLEALATRSGDAPRLRLTAVFGGAALHQVAKEIGARLKKFARLMGIPFDFRAVHHDGDPAELDFESLGGGGTAASGGAGLAVNCVNTLHGVPSGERRNAMAAALRRLRPKIVTVVEEVADLRPEDCGDFARSFAESLRFFTAYFDSLEESFPKTSNERLALEKAAERAIMDLVAGDPARSTERRETAASWSARMSAAGFSPLPLSDDVGDDLSALLKRYREGWSMAAPPPAGTFLLWKEQPVVWASAWKPSPPPPPH